jgi:acyl-lipid omega-6 desaturase (Delta-12 desaturase)
VIAQGPQTSVLHSGADAEDLLDDAKSLHAITEPFQQPSTARACWQLANTLVPYFAVWYLIYLAAQISVWLTVPLSAIAAAFLIRIFIIFHDCGHGSYFRSRRLNAYVGFVTGLLTFCPFVHWRWEHALHHGSAGDLDRRGTGDIWTMTLREYQEASWSRRVHYRIVRNPLVLFGVAPFLVFALKHRVSSRRANPSQRHSVWWMNIALLIVGTLASLAMGLVPYLVAQFAALTFAGAAGLWLFYVQHQFEGVYWERTEKWSYTAAALRGSSFYKLPKILQWFSGNIGFHHIHHLNPRIANYNLQRCHESTPIFACVKQITLRSSLRSLRVHLWDEETRTLVKFPRALR